MPVAKSVWSQYVDGEQLDWKKDARGRGGILSLHPFHESGDLEEVWETQKYLDAAIQVRELLVGGDLRALRMKEMVNDPTKWLREAEQLVDARGTQNYKAAAEILCDLREAVGGDEGDQITRRHAAHLAGKHPTLNHLKSALRKRGLLE